MSKDPTGKIKKSRLEPIPGIVPNMLDLPKGCRFQDRCKFVEDRCKVAEPELLPAGSGRFVRCVRV
jgi:oligopeptide/dipeptide ABC transporter ATP-binding protein